MSVPDFAFAVRISGGAPLEDLLNDVASAVLRHAGCVPEAVDELTTALRGALLEARRQSEGGLGVQLRAHAGELEIAVSQGERWTWRTSRSMP